MSDNVVPFPSRGSLHEKRDPRANEERLRHIERMKLKAIRDSFEQKPRPRFDKPSDRLQAVIALRELKKDRLPHRGQLELVKQKLTEKEFGWHHGRKVHRFIAPDKLDCSDREKTKAFAAKLTAKIEKYLEVARAIAAIAKCDEEDTQIRVLRDTTFWKKSGLSVVQGDGSNQPDEAAENLALLLHELSARVIRDTRLAKLFARIRRVPGQWDVHTGRFGRGSGACLFRTSYAFALELDDDAPPLPSIPLFRLWHSSWKFPARIVQNDSIDGSRDELQPFLDQSGGAVTAEVHVFREIRLALGPTVNAETLGIMFETRSHVELQLPEQGRNSDPLFRFGYLTEPSYLLLDKTWYEISSLVPWREISHRLELSGPWHPAGTHAVNDELSWSTSSATADPPRSDRRDLNIRFNTWTPVDAEHVAHWLDRDVVPLPPFEHAQSNNTISGTWYPLPLVAHFIELAISDGRLEAALTDEIKRIRTAFEQHETKWRERMRERDAALIAEWESDLRAAASLQTKSEDFSNDQPN